MTGTCFVARLLRRNFPSIERLREERYQLHKFGVSHSDWRLMTRWQRQDLLSRHLEDAKKKAAMVKQSGLKGAVGAVIAKVLGLG